MNLAIHQWTHRGITAVVRLKDRTAEWSAKINDQLYGNSVERNNIPVSLVLTVLKNDFIKTVNTHAKTA